MEFRIEKDSMGEIKVPKDAYYGAQTQRSIINFPIGHEVMPEIFIRAYALIKQSAALTNQNLGILAEEKAQLIIKASQDIIDGKLLDQFPLKIWQTWQLSLQAIKWDESVLAENLLLKLVDETQDLIAKDRIELNLGRLLFTKKDFQGAIDHYQKVSKGSDFWFEALEEEAWSYIRLNQPDKATSKLTTLLSPVFQNAVGPETYYAANYNALKICDYTTVFKNGKLFKERQQVRIRSLEALAKSGVQELLPQALAGMVVGKASYSDYGKEAAVLPRFFWRDSELQDIAHLIKSKTLSNNSETKINEIKNLEKKFSLKMQQMAQSELADYRRVIDKLQIIEAEVIQRLYLDPNLKAKRTEELVPPPTNADVLTFPHDEELWLDEIDSYQSRIKLCPQLKEVRI